MNASWLQTIELCRHYQRGPHTVRAVDGVDIALAQGEFVAVVGSSGSGKSTLLNLMAGLDTPTSGSVLCEGIDLGKISRRELSAYRAKKVGMVFQSFNLLPYKTAVENVEMALMFNHTPRNERTPRAMAMLERLGLGDRTDHNPADLSGGEQQRVAIARALVKEPQILFADEPTGNLDHDNSQEISKLLTELNHDGLTVVMVTHDLDLAKQYASRVIRMNYGKVVSIEGDAK